MRWPLMWKSDHEDRLAVLEAAALDMRQQAVTMCRELGSQLVKLGADREKDNVKFEQQEYRIEWTLKYYCTCELTGDGTCRACAIHDRMIDQEILIGPWNHGERIAPEMWPDWKTK